jgi:Ca-activated chloride channel family protein
MPMRILICIAAALALPGCFMPGDGDAAGSGNDDGPMAPWDGSGAGSTAGEMPPPSDEGGESEGGSDESGEDVEAPHECNADDRVALFLSPDDSNSMSSPVQAREAALDAFSSLSAVAIRPWEFLNYYSFDYAPADPGTLALSTSMRREDDDAYTLQIAVTAETIAPEARAPMNITFVLDTSGSMEGHPMDMLKATCRAVASSLREGDIVSLVTWNTENLVHLRSHVVDGPNDALLLERIASLTAAGGTDLHGGLVAGYELASESFSSQRINRIVLVSDGGANAGITDIDLIAAHAGGNTEDGIYMLGVGVGDATTYHDQLMDQVTDAGKGASLFVNDELEAQRMFGERFVSTMSVAARDVQVRLDMPPGFEIVRFSGEEVSADPTEVEPQHLAPNDSMVFHQSIETCAPDLVDDDAVITVTVRWLDARTFQQREMTQTVRFDEMLAQVDPALLKGAAIFAYAEGLKAMRDGDPDAIAQARPALDAAKAVLPDDADLAEIELVLSSL